MRKYTKRSDRARRSEANTANTAIRGMLEGFIREDREGAISMLNSIRPKDVIEEVLGRSLTIAECDLYLLAISDLPKDLREAFRIGQIWQDLSQASRKFLQGRSMDTKSEVVDRFKNFLAGMEKKGGEVMR